MTPPTAPQAAAPRNALEICLALADVVTVYVNPHHVTVVFEPYALDTDVCVHEDGTYTYLGNTYSGCEHGLDWAAVVENVAADKAHALAARAKADTAPPVWTETLDELGAWRSDILCASAWVFVALAVAFLSGYVVGSWT